jgi:(hydroxyamino)benzene mutase
MNVQRGGRQILIHGAALVLVGLVWGLFVPATPHPRLALGAHTQFVSNGMLFIILATALLALPHRVGPRSVWVMVLAVWLTWAMALSEVANSWWGTTQTLPIAASQAGVTGAGSWQELAVRLPHMGAGLVLIIAWSLFIAGLLKLPSGAGADARNAP